MSSPAAWAAPDPPHRRRIRSGAWAGAGASVCLHGLAALALVLAAGVHGHSSRVALPPAIEVVLEATTVPEPVAAKSVPLPPDTTPPDALPMQTPPHREPASRPRQAAKPDPAVRAAQVPAPEPERTPPAAAAVEPASASAPLAAAAATPVAATDEMTHYAAAISRALAEARRRHRGSGGRAVVTFSLDAAGGLVEASVARGSGDPGLDARALAIVRAAEFPAPPAGFTARDRVFTVPFEFR